MTGKRIRLNRIIKSSTGRACIVPIDHGVTLGPIKGIENPTGLVREVSEAGADAIVVHKGILRRLVNEGLVNYNYILHLSASTTIGPDMTRKVLIASVEEAVQLGADGVSIHVNLECETESKMLSDLGNVSRECYNFGMPLLVMIYSQTNKKDEVQIAHAARIAEELGADMIKISCPENPESLLEIVNCVNTPLFIAGGEKTGDIENFFQAIKTAIACGIKGVAIGRNVFQHENPGLITSLICKMIKEESTFDQIFSQLKNLALIAE